MTDLEITKLCAAAMGLPTDVAQEDETGPYLKCSRYYRYQPLHDDAQAMALVKKFRLSVNSYNDEYQVWPTRIDQDTAGKACTFHADLNRAIVRCVAKMRQAKGGK